MKFQSQIEKAAGIKKGANLTSTGNIDMVNMA